MSHDELARKIHNYEILAAETMTEIQRGALRDEVQQLHDAISPSRTMTKYALGGAAAGVVLPVVGLFSGGAAGALYGAVRAHGAEMTDARRRLTQLLEQLR